MSSCLKGRGRRKGKRVRERTGEARRGEGSYGKRGNIGDEEEDGELGEGDHGGRGKRGKGR
jgi:hypothetical protein